MLESLLNLDYFIFNTLHVGLSSSFLDQVLLLFYSPSTTAVASVLLFIFLAWGFYHKYGVAGFALLVLTVLQLSFVDKTVSPIKSLTQRTRPEFTENLKALPKLKSETSYSLPSGHAVDAFFLATLVGLLLPHLRMPLFVLAFMVGISRVYAGLHFPSDILLGALYGGFLGWFIYKIEKRFTDKLMRPFV